MKKILILISAFSFLTAYSQIQEVAIFNNSSTYDLKGVLTAGATSGSNCGITISNNNPAGIEIAMGGEARYIDYKGQRDSSSFPVYEWLVDDGIHPPTVFAFDDPYLSYNMPPITDWSTFGFDLKDSNGTLIYTGFIQNQNYPCASNPSYISTTGLSQNIEAYWTSMIDPNTGQTILMIIIDDI